MPFPLLALGILAGNELLRQYKQSSKEEQVAERYRGLLGTAPTEMGPPTADGEMAQQPGSGLLGQIGNVKDPLIREQLQLAAGITGLPGQQVPGLNMLNAAFGRAQQEAQMAQQGDQFNRSFQAGRDDASAVGSRFVQSMEQQQAEARQRAQQWSQSFGLDQQRFGLQQSEAQRAASQFEQSFGLQKKRFGLEQQESDAKANAGPGMPKLEAGYQWVADPGGSGGAIAAPIPGTQDYAKGVGGLESLAQTQKQIGQFLDLVQGVEETTKQGKKVRIGGAGTEYGGQTAARMSTLRAGIISGVAKLRDMGVLQPGEMENIEEQLPDPTSLKSNLTLTRQSTFGAAYGELNKQFKAKARAHLKANPWLVPTMPAGFKPAEE